MRSYQYGGVSYANPHALTSLSNGYSSSTFADDNNGNVTQKTTDGVSYNIYLGLCKPPDRARRQQRHHHLRI